MGDRGNIKVIEREFHHCVYLYAHWAGADLPVVLREALVMQARWDDAPYLTRIIFEKMVDMQSDKELGFGISSTLIDADYPTLVVDVDSQEVYLEEPDVGYVEPAPARLPGVTYSFAEFAEGKWDTKEFSEAYDS